MAHLLNKTPEFIEQNTSRALQKPQYNKILRKHQKKKKKNQYSNYKGTEILKPSKV